MVIISAVLVFLSMFTLKMTDEGLSYVEEVVVVVVILKPSLKKRKNIIFIRLSNI